MARKKYRLGKVVDLDKVVKREKKASPPTSSIIKLTCADCREELAVNAMYKGRSVRLYCPNCGGTYLYSL